MFQNQFASLIVVIIPFFKINSMRKRREKEKKRKEKEKEKRNRERERERKDTRQAIRLLGESFSLIKVHNIVSTVSPFLFFFHF